MIVLSWITPIVMIIRTRTASAMMLRILIEYHRRQIVATTATVRRPIGPVARDGHEQRVDQGRLARIVRPNDQDIERVGDEFEGTTNINKLLIN